MSQSLTALLWTPLVTIWKPLAVAVWSSTGDRSREGSAQGFPNTPTPRTLCSAYTKLYAELTSYTRTHGDDRTRERAGVTSVRAGESLPEPRQTGSALTLRDPEASTPNLQRHAHPPDPASTQQSDETGKQESPPGRPTTPQPCAKDSHGLSSQRIVTCSLLTRNTCFCISGQGLRTA